MNLKNILNYGKMFFKWLLIGIIIGGICGILGSAFHLSIDYVTEFRMENSCILLLLPFGGLIITLLYSLFNKQGKIDTNRVIESKRNDDEKVPLVMAPLIFISTIITHLFGGSAGREGAALQLGGSIGYNVGKLFRLNKKNMHIIVMSGMSGVFAALFGTPLTAAIFSLEVVNVGVFHYAALLPCVISSVVSYEIANMLGISPVHFSGVIFESLSMELVIKVILLSVLFALISILFCFSIKKCEHYSKKFIRNNYIRAFAGGIIIVLLTILLRTYDYNGTGMNVITDAISGNAKPEAFILKIIFTAITISAGFKGGEIVPAFFVGSTFGCVAGSILGIDAGFGAAMGFVALFCGVVNCPIASIFLALEVFGEEGILFFTIVCSVSYMMSGCFGLYKSQKIIYSKLDAELIDINTK